jgi:hypothetical protein
MGKIFLLMSKHGLGKVSEQFHSSIYNYTTQFRNCSIHIMLWDCIKSTFYIKY